MFLKLLGLDWITGAAMLKDNLSCVTSAAHCITMVPVLSVGHMSEKVVSNYVIHPSMLIWFLLLDAF